MRLIDADKLEREIMLLPDEDLCEDCCYTFVNAINAAPTVGGWVSVKDRLPEVGVTCLVAFGDEGLSFSSLDKSGKWYVVNGLPQPDYWMPLPDVPGR